MAKFPSKSGEKRKLLYEGFPFTFDKHLEGKQQKYWRCEKRCRGCKARIWTDFDNNVVTNKCENTQHTNHDEPSKRKLKSEKAQSNLSR